MTAVALVAQLRSRGLQLRVVGATLQVAPRMMLTEADRVAIREHLLELKALVEAETDLAVTAEPAVCAPTSRREDAETDDAVVAATDHDVAMALEVFTGARVVAHNQPAVWPPRDGWVPSSANTIAIYATVMPTVPCPCCGATTWRRAGSGWCCSRCHPDPRAVCVRTTGTTCERRRGRGV